MKQSAFWLDRPVFVTGATGLVGSYVVRDLVDAGADVVCLERDWVPFSLFHSLGLSQRVKIVKGDVTQRETVERVLAEYEIRTVFHLAAQTIVGVANQYPIGTFAMNIAGTWNVLEACRCCRSVQQVVFASSDKAYGEHPVLPYDESMPLQGKNPYDVSKSCADLLAQSYAHAYGLPVAISRCGNFYGGGDLNWNRLIPGTIRSIVRNQAPVIRSDGQFSRDYLFVEDGAKAYLLLAEALATDDALRGQAFNFSTEEQYSALEIVQTILQTMDSTLTPKILNEAVNEIRHQHLSAAKAKKILGWKAEHSLKTGLEKTIKWYRTFLADADA